MVIYEVNLAVDPEIETSFRTWLREHMLEMLTFDGFTEAHLFERETPEGEVAKNAQKLLTVHYRVTDRERLQDYLDRHANKMRQEGKTLFRDRFTATRRILFPQPPLT